MRERKDLAMRNQRSSSLEFKRQVVEELLSGGSHPARSAGDIASHRAYFSNGKLFSKH